MTSYRIRIQGKQNRCNSKSKKNMIFLFLKTKKKSSFVYFFRSTDVVDSIRMINIIHSFLFRTRNKSCSHVKVLFVPNVISICRQLKCFKSISKMFMLNNHHRPSKAYFLSPNKRSKVSKTISRRFQLNRSSTTLNSSPLKYLNHSRWATFERSTTCSFKFEKTNTIKSKWKLFDCLFDSLD